MGNPLDYTALIWGDVERLRDIVVTVGADPSLDRVLVFYDQAADAGRGGSWAAVREGIRLGAERCAVPVMVSSTLPELLDEAAAIKFMDAGVPAVAGLRTGLACAAALTRRRPARRRGCARSRGSARGAHRRPLRPARNGSRWLPSTRPRSCFGRPASRSSRDGSSPVRTTRLSRSWSSAVTLPSS